MSFSASTDGNEVVSTFAEQVKGRTFLLTGPSVAGIGSETVLSLARAAPSTLILAGRSEDKIRPIIDQIQSIDSSIHVIFQMLDLSSLDSVRQAADSILKNSDVPKIDVFINNAAVMACPYSKTIDGIESQFATNHIGPFLFTNLLMPKILAAGLGSRIVNVSSSAHGFGTGDYSDYNSEKGYNEFIAYGQSKLGNVLFTKSLATKLGSRGIQTYSLNPGSIVSPLQRYLTPELLSEGYRLAKEKHPDFKPEPRKTLQQGCSTTLVAALDPELGQNGAYLHNCQPTSVAVEGDLTEMASKLWTLSESLVGQSFVY